MNASLVRPAVESDLPRLTEIYNHYVQSGPITFDTRAFSVEERRGWFGQFAQTGCYRLLVAERDGSVVGYAASMPFRAKPAYRTSVETTVYVAPGLTGKGLGTLLYGGLFDALRGETLHRAYAGITLPNEASVRLHRSFEFEYIGLFQEVGHKHGRYWDVAWYQKKLFR